MGHDYERHVYRPMAITWRRPLERIGPTQPAKSAEVTVMGTRPIDEFDWPGASPIRPEEAEEFDPRWADFGGRCPDLDEPDWLRPVVDAACLTLVTLLVIASLGLFALVLAAGRSHR
jgi:hypothetical protein